MIEGLRDFVTCLRLHAFARGEAECTSSRILIVISEDPRNLEIFNKTTDVQECFVGENLVNVMTLSFWIDRYGQTDRTQIKAFLMTGC